MGEPLTKAAEISEDDRTITIVLRALRSLAEDFCCLERMLLLDSFRTDTLVLYEQSDEKEAADLISYLNDTENAIHIAESTWKASQQHLKNAPSVKYLAEIFNKYSPMEGEVSFEKLLLILKEVPVGPANDVVTYLYNQRNSTFSFGSLAQHVYGTPTLVGWWPSLMESVGELWARPKFQELKPPCLMELLSYFELGAKGASRLASDIILYEVLPAWNLPTEGECIEDAFAEIRGETLDFNDFGKWMCTYFTALDKQREMDQSAAQEESEARQRELSALNSS